MKSRIALLALASVFGVVMSTPQHIRAQQPPQAGHDHDHAPASAAAPSAPAQSAVQMDMMGRMKASQQKLDALVTQMHDAKGAQKTDAIAALLTALVQDHRQMHDMMMANMSGMMNMMAGTHGDGEMKAPPKK